jgi:hypothetical protein
VAITVTAKADLATQAIRERVTRLVSASRVLTVNSALATAQKNDDLDGGGLARCPVVTDATTTVDGKDVEGGSRITVRADKPDQVAALQKEAKARAAALPKR